MKITSSNHDSVSARLTVTVEKNDYKAKVEKTLVDYAKKASIPGFRKGKAPLSMIKKQYESGVAYEEVNKLVSETLNNYINENKLKLVGQPLPEAVDELDFNAEELSVAFEVGYEPAFDVDLNHYETVLYKVEAQDKEVNQSIENMQKRFADKVPQEKVEKNSHIALEVKELGEETEDYKVKSKQATISEKEDAAFALVKGKSVGDSLKVSKVDLLNNETLEKALGFYKGESEILKNDEVEITIKEIYELTLAELNQELFDKIYGEGVITSEEGLKDRVKSELDDYFQQTADVFFVNKILEQIIKEDELKLPEDFLVKWLLQTNENITSEEQAKEILVQQMPQMKRQIVEGKLRAKYNINVDYNEVLTQAELFLRNQFSVYGVHHLSEENIREYAVGMLKNQEQVAKFSSEVAMTKIKDVILEQAKKNEQPISYDDFVSKMGEQE